MSMANVDHFELVVSDVERAAEFYAKLGAKVVREASGSGAGSDRQRVALQIGKDTEMNLVTPSDVARSRREALPGGGHVCLSWDGAMDQYMALLAGNGLKPREERGGPSPVNATRGAGTHIYIYDPDGNSIEVVCYPEATPARV
ncbi:MAG: hypothetical protein EXR58_03275 [Chloroflexi bacterium]|nr:hypothetical protein [Chloroflexota bacterium]